MAYELPPIHRLPKSVHAAAQKAMRATEILREATKAAAEAYALNENRERDFITRLNAAVAEGKPHTEVVDDRAKREADAAASEAHKQVARRQAEAAWVELRREIAAHPEAVDNLDALVERAADEYRDVVAVLEAKRADYAEALGIRTWWSSATMQPANPSAEPRLSPYRPAPVTEVQYNQSNAGMAIKRGTVEDAVKILRADAEGLEALRKREAKAQARVEHEAKAQAIAKAVRDDFDAQQQRARLARAARFAEAD